MMKRRRRRRPVGRAIMTAFEGLAFLSLARRLGARRSWRLASAVAAARLADRRGRNHARRRTQPNALWKEL